MYSAYFYDLNPLDYYICIVVGRTAKMNTHNSIATNSLVNILAAMVNILNAHVITACQGFNLEEFIANGTCSIE